MAALKNLFASFSRPASSVAPRMKHAPAPPVTVPTAIKAQQETKAAGLQEGIETATFAGGCFWGTEHLFNKHFGELPGWKCLSGYTGGDEADPSEWYFFFGPQSYSGPGSGASGPCIIHDIASVAAGTSLTQRSIPQGRIRPDRPRRVGPDDIPKGRSLVC